VTHGEDKHRGKSCVQVASQRTQLFKFSLAGQVVVTGETVVVGTSPGSRMGTVVKEPKMGNGVVVVGLKGLKAVVVSIGIPPGTVTKKGVVVDIVIEGSAAGPAGVVPKNGVEDMAAMEVVVLASAAAGAKAPHSRRPTQLPLNARKVPKLQVQMALQGIVGHMGRGAVQVASQRTHSLKVSPVGHWGIVVVVIRVVVLIISPEGLPNAVVVEGIIVVVEAMPLSPIGGNIVEVVAGVPNISDQVVVMPGEVVVVVAPDVAEEEHCAHGIQVPLVVPRSIPCIH
jgi:hypothetical protein